MPGFTYPTISRMEHALCRECDRERTTCCLIRLAGSGKVMVCAGCRLNLTDGGHRWMPEEGWGAALEEPDGKNITNFKEWAAANPPLDGFEDA